MTSPSPSPTRRRSLCALCFTSPATRSVAWGGSASKPHGNIRLCDACEPRRSPWTPESESPPSSPLPSPAPESRKRVRKRESGKRDWKKKYRDRKARLLAERVAAGHRTLCSVCLTAPATRLLDWGAKPCAVSLCDTCEPGKRRPTDVEVSLVEMEKKRKRVYLKTPKPTSLARRLADATGLPLGEVSQLLYAGRTSAEILQGVGVLKGADGRETDAKDVRKRKE